MSKPAILPTTVTELADSLSQLPGVGPRLASRIAIFLATKGENSRQQLQGLLRKVAEEVRICAQCGNLSTEELCTVCADTSRNQEQILVVETALDLLQVEKAEMYKGTYLVIGQLISPINGVLAKDTNLELLWPRLAEGEVEEVIIGLPSSVEADATALYIKQQISQRFAKVKISRLARGLAAGVSVEYIDPLSLTGALTHRVEME